MKGGRWRESQQVSQCKPSCCLCRTAHAHTHTHSISAWIGVSCESVRDADYLEKSFPDRTQRVGCPSGCTCNSLLLQTNLLWARGERSKSFNGYSDDLINLYPASPFCVFRTCAVFLESAPLRVIGVTPRLLKTAR